MNTILSESLLILGLILLNGFFAAAEIAIISLRQSKTKELIQNGVKSARVVSDLQKNPETFLATIQVGITLVSTFASAFGGASLVEEIAPLMKKVPVELISTHSEGAAFVLVVILISYFSLIFGELVPKSLALRFAQKIALFVCYPIKFFSVVFFVFVKFLTFSSNVVLAPFKDKTNFSEAKLSEEEIRYLIEESRQAGTIEKREHEFIENVFDFGDLEVGKIMLPPNKITAFEVSESPKKIIAHLMKRNYSRVPVYEEQFDNVVGVLYSKDIMEKLARGRKIEIRKLIRPPLFVPTTQRLHDVLQKFKREKMHMAIVLDEHGGVAGLVTLEDILEELVGDITDESDETVNEIREQDDGSYLVDASTPVTDLNRVIGSQIPETGQYNSLSGFLLVLAKRFPRKGEKIRYKNWLFQVKEKTTKGIKLVQVRKLKGKKKS
ncbi:MAG TPA: hemolysin family protein [Candidatus Gracilibacteria bacterium]|nr:hemolysin family protein [Candidatus Gracilibacteria bacterium]